MAEVDKLVEELKRSRKVSKNKPTVYFIRADEGIRQAENYLYRMGYLSGFEIRNVEINNNRLKSSTSVLKGTLLQDLDLTYSDNPLILNGSGNLHHFTYAFCRKLIDRRSLPYSVLDFDKHLDYKKPLIRITCGNFNHEIIRDSEFCNGIVVVQSPSYIKKYGKDDGNVSIKTITTQNASINERIRNVIQELNTNYVYITLDLDCLRSDMQTDWGNGNLETDFVLRTIDDASNGKEIIGVDVCGLRSYGVDERTLMTFARIFELISNIRYSSSLSSYQKRLTEELRRISG